MAIIQCKTKLSAVFDMRPHPKYCICVGRISGMDILVVMWKTWVHEVVLH